MPTKSTRRKKGASNHPEDAGIRRDLQDSSKGKDLSYLNEMPQMGGYEGVKAGVPPQKEEKGKDYRTGNKNYKR